MEEERIEGWKESEKASCRYATCLVVQAQATFTLYLQCIQRAQTGFINPIDYSVNVYPRIYALFLRVTPSMFNLKPHDCIYLAIDCWYDATLYIYICIQFFFSFSFLLLLPPLRLLPLSPLLVLLLRVFHISLSYSLSFPYFFANQPTMDFFPPFFQRIPFPRAMNLLLMILFLHRLHAPDKNLGPFLGNNVSVIGDRSRCRGW